MGIFATVIFDSESRAVIESENVGILLRTKANFLDEGGISKGYAAIDSPHLIGDDVYFADSMQVQSTVGL